MLSKFIYYKLIIMNLKALFYDLDDDIFYLNSILDIIYFLILSTNLYNMKSGNICRY